MTLFTLEQLISNLAISLKGVSYACAGASVYDINSLTVRNYPLVYTSPTGTQDVQDNTTSYELTIFYIDRLLEDNSNDNDIFSTAIETLKILAKKIESFEGVLNVERNGITLFTEKEKFSDRCAGAFMNITTLAANNNVCEEI